jgi:hypothetical protein
MFRPSRRRPAPHVAPFAMPSFAEQPAANRCSPPPLQAEPVVSDQAAPPPAPARETEAQADPYDLPTIDFMMEEAPRGLHIAPYPAPLRDRRATPQGPAPGGCGRMKASGDDMWHTLPPVVSETDMPSPGPHADFRRFPGCGPGPRTSPHPAGGGVTDPRPDDGTARNQTRAASGRRIAPARYHQARHDRARTGPCHDRRHPGPAARRTGSASPMPRRWAT